MAVAAALLHFQWYLVMMMDEEIMISGISWQIMVFGF